MFLLKNGSNETALEEVPDKNLEPTSISSIKPFVMVEN
jgi:hypothetical protein